MTKSKKNLLFFYAKKDVNKSMLDIYIYHQSLYERL
jgi:hypothetical protein